ncbi:MAG: hypothetical protein CM15mP95_2630 [Alphaproteobacteria bacterium]|nr:MAG: hypothetical protein CM15mP95_2630 [Alphaproteobacteria bacterium]
MLGSVIFIQKIRTVHGITHYGQTVTDCFIQPIIEKLVNDSEYYSRRTAIVAFNKSNRYLKRGIAITPVKFGISFNTTFLNQAGALVHVYHDGSVHLNHGGTEMGQGLNTKVAQIVAHEFQIDFEKVRISATTTGKVPNTSATAASSGTDLNGMAAMRAAREIKTRIVDFLAEVYQTKPNRVRFADNMVHIGAEVISFSSAVRQAYMGRISLSATGYYATPKLKWDASTMRGRPFYYFAYGAAASEVVVDLLTGENRVVRVDLLHDAGKSINPAFTLVRSRGFLQGVWWLTTEELVWDEVAALQRMRLLLIKFQLALIGRSIGVLAFSQTKIAKIQSIGLRQVGEPPLMLAISVWLALSDALSGIDGAEYPALDAPATPERILMTARRLGARFVSSDQQTCGLSTGSWCVRF